MKNGIHSNKITIATNAPEYFNHNDIYRFVALGDDSEKNASHIVLMLPTNWNINSIEQIETLTHQVSAYPLSTSAFIIGAEFQFPANVTFEKIKAVFKNTKRDGAVKKLCQTILSRSPSIGVRGDITKAYLVEVLGFSPETIDVIYEPNTSASDDRLENFVNKNAPFLLNHLSNICRFQKNPLIFNQQPLNFDRKLLVGKPFLEQNGDKARLNLVITVNGRDHCLWVETHKQYTNYLTVDRIDPFLLLLIPFAMRKGHDIVSQTPASDRLIYNVKEVLIPNLCSGDSRLHFPDLNIPSSGESLPCGELIATGMSCGIDSFYSTMVTLTNDLESHKLNALYCGNYLYGNESLIYERADSVARQLNLPLISTSTNINKELDLPHIETHFYKTLFGVIALRKLFKAYYYSSAGNFTGFNLKGNGSNDTALYELLLLYVFSDENFQILSGGGGATRLEKTERLINFSPARFNLNVCIFPNKEKNCGQCGKCLRTLLTLDMLGALDKFSNVFDIDNYKNNREVHLQYLKGRANDYMLKDVYEYFYVDGVQK
jgi:hypothetical protein